MKILGQQLVFLSAGIAAYTSAFIAVSPIDPWRKIVVYLALVAAGVCGFAIAYLGQRSARTSDEEASRPSDEEASRPSDAAPSVVAEEAAWEPKTFYGKGKPLVMPAEVVGHYRKMSLTQQCLLDSMVALSFDTFHPSSPLRNHAITIASAHPACARWLMDVADKLDKDKANG